MFMTCDYNFCIDLKSIGITCDETKKKCAFDRKSVCPFIVKKFKSCHGKFGAKFL